MTAMIDLLDKIAQKQEIKRLDYTIRSEGLKFGTTTCAIGAIIDSLETRKPQKVLAVNKNDHKFDRSVFSRIVKIYKRKGVIVECRKVDHAVYELELMENKNG